MFSDRKAPKSDRKATKSGRKIRFSFFMNFFEFLNFETEKFEISPEFVSRTQPVTVNFPVNRIYRPKIFSLLVHDKASLRNDPGLVLIQRNSPGCLTFQEDWNGVSRSLWLTATDGTSDCTLHSYCSTTIQSNDSSVQS